MKNRFKYFLLLLITPAIALAEEQINQANTAWVLTSTALVLFMTLPGLALFYGGLVRSKNILTVLMQCFSIACFISIIWVVIGYSLAFGNGGEYNAWIGGLDKVMLKGITTDSVFSGIPETVFVMFQMTFAIITPALIVGGFAERIKFSAMLLFSCLWLIFVYTPVCHWVWAEGGWLYSRNVMDFAGGTVVHINAGVAALVAAVIVGKRKGFHETAMMPHNLTMTVTGAAMLWVGWFGFNAGSALAANGSAGMAMLVTHIGAATGAISWITIEWIRYGKPSVLGIVTGMVAGLGTITPASGFVDPMGAMIIGFTAGIVCYFATQFIKNVVKIDDSLDVFPVHGVGGILGTVMAGFLAVEYAEGVTMSSQVQTQLIAVGAVFLWSLVISAILLKTIDLVMGLRPSLEDEISGLDIALHEESGYNI